ncbi:MAG: ribonuclease H-like domain-containing protein, partial [Methanobacteriaceae archaeon]|nr:ribonuclease H-like domain-containing protein [Methanobacteriaceae archaeon]
DIEGGEIVENKYGECLKVSYREKIDFNLKKSDIKKDILSDFKLLDGIGENKEAKLKSKGYETLYDLLEHETYSTKAKELIDSLEGKCFINYYNKLEDLSKYSKKSKSRLIKSASILNGANFKFMDIETVGLSSNVPVILIGVAEINGKYIDAHLYQARNYHEEAAILESYFSHLDESSVHVTYNGSTFDIPFIKARANYYRMDKNKINLMNLTHFDLIKFTRALWKDKLENCKLTTIENYLNIPRDDDDVNGAYIADYYDTYLKENNIGPLMPILKHNCRDIISLASFLMRINEEVCNE